jgi:GNAT superfamily N-acetyltransferase
MIRIAKRQDADIVCSLIDGLADYEKLERPTPEAKARLKEHGWPEDGSAPRFSVLLAIDDASETPVGYAITFETYSTFLAQPTLYLEDIFVLPGHRGHGHGKALLTTLIESAKTQGYGRVEWVVLDWNTSARAFYESLGAGYMSEWLHYRIPL